ncbi:hypothetical protein GIB67_040421 [Kingdonia uniflora]|uniref:Uncharacterized protein n=1 Tax=Kingdonia uniflora TaxID=39325 RepID=A0A7J7KXK8_9MAGN|nr:hypothetical protein GIB67_040421 [Kingdonia uniflora]
MEKCNTWGRRTLKRISVMRQIYLVGMNYKFEEVHRGRKWAILYFGGVSDNPKFLQWSKETIINVELSSFGI